MKHLLLASLITLLAFGTACEQAAEPEPVVSDGIQVHGDWTVTVTNPDGTVDAVHEFENELIDDGEAYTALILNEASASYFSIMLFSTFTDSFLSCAGATNNSSHASTLTAATSRDLNTQGTPIVITATCDVGEFSGDIVITEVRHCIGFDQPISTSNSTSPTLEGTCVTKHVFSNSQQITVQNGQTLTFNVAVGFS